MQMLIAERVALLRRVASSVDYAAFEELLQAGVAEAKTALLNTTDRDEMLRLQGAGRRMHEMLTAIQDSRK